MRTWNRALCVWGGLLICALCCGAVGRADPPGACCLPGGTYGDGSDGYKVISTNTTLGRDMNYQLLVVNAGVTLDTAGHTVRVCQTLFNYGVITDSANGGPGGLGGAAGLGANKLQNAVPAGCPARQVECTPGLPGQPGGPPPVPQAGSGGYGGGGGGGGGGAWWNLDQPDAQDADGGNGGAGGAGGKGGGYVRIFALHLENYGVIHADGMPGGLGASAPNDPNDCGAEYNRFLDIVYYRDIAGGGGGGGAGGVGGAGGTVEVHCAYLDAEGEIHANPGPSGTGGSGGLSGTSQMGHWLYYGATPGGHSGGCAGGPPGASGQGGRGADTFHDWAEDGQPGNPGGPGTPGTRILDTAFSDCNGNGVPDDCDLTSRGVLAFSRTTPVALYAVDPDEGIAAQLCELPGDTTFGAGLARHPHTGVLYAALDMASEQQRLRTLDLTCQVNDIGLLNPSMDAITFCDCGTLYGVSRSGSIYVIDPNNASTHATDVHLGAASLPYEIACEPGTRNLYYAFSLVLIHTPPPGYYVCFPHFGWIDMNTGQDTQLPTNCMPERPGAIAFSGSWLLAYGSSVCGMSPCFDKLYYIEQSNWCWGELADSDVCMTAMTAWQGLPDCNSNAVPDECDVPPLGSGPDCNRNGVPDECDIACCDGSLWCRDCNSNGIPDGCEVLCDDCNLNGIPDECDIAADPSLDTFPHNGYLDECDRDRDCNTNGLMDWCDISCDPPCNVPGCGQSRDCNGNGIPDECDIAEGSGGDCHICLGDSNCDGEVSWRDIDYFVAAMSGEQAWRNMFHPWQPTCAYWNNDINNDCVVNWRDIDPFVIRMGTVCP